MFDQRQLVASDELGTGQQTVVLRANSESRDENGQGLTYAAAYLGVGSGAYEIACQEGNRRFASGSRRLDAPINQRRMADLAIQIEAAQTLLHGVASMFDRGRLTSMAPVMQAKVFCSETAVRATQELMTMFGGTAFASRLPFERYFRDARAGLIMALANDATYQDLASMLYREDDAGS